MVKQYKSGVPLGGLGCGKIELCPDGAFRNITTHNNLDIPFSSVETKPWPETVTASNEYSATGLDEAFLFAAVEGQGARLLKATAEKGFEAPTTTQLGFLGEFPRAVVRCQDFEGIELSVEAFTPIIPQEGEPRDSTLPAAIFLMRGTNARSTARRVALGLSWPNVIGVGGYPSAQLVDVRGNSTRHRSLDGVECLRLFHSVPKVDRRLNGEYVMLVRSGSGCHASWVVGRWNNKLWNYFVNHQCLPNSQSGESLGAEGAVAPGSTAALCVTVELAPGQSFEEPMVLAWYFPDKPANAKPEVVYRNAYAKHFADGLEVARYALSNARRLHTATREWQQTIQNSSLPSWLSYKLINNLFPMVSCSMYLSDGRFGINEAPTHMNGCMGTIDQRSACVTPYLALFPAIAQSELRQFGNQQIGADHPERYGQHWSTLNGQFGCELDRLGAIKHEIGWDELEEGKYGGKVWCNLHWPDLSAVFVLQCYQQIIWTGDREFFSEVWPKIKLALEFHQRLDQDGDGLADLWGPGSSTFDNDQYPYYGACTFVATLYLAALKAAMALARHLGETDQITRWEADFARAQATVERELWNEARGHYNSWVDRNHEGWKGSEREHEAASENTVLSHLAGEWFAQMLGLGPILDEGRVRRSLETLYERNVRPFAYCAPNEVKPDGSKSLSWPYYGEAYFAATAIYHGQVENGMEMVRKFYEAAFVQNDSHWDLPLTWEGDDNSKPWWGRWYMTTPSSWNVLLAITGARYNALEKSLALVPVCPSEMSDFRAVPIFLPGFRGSLSTVDGFHFEVKQASSDTGIPIKQLRVPLHFRGIPMLNGQAVAIESDKVDQKVRILGLDIALRSGDALVIQQEA